MWRASGINLLRRAVTPAASRLVGQPFLRYSGGGGGGSEKSGGSGNAMSYGEAKRLMRVANVEALKEKLGAEEREVILYEELLTLCRVAGVVNTEDEAAAFARSLDDAGVVLLFRDKVHLQPEKVADLVRKAVPVSLLPDEDPWEDELKKLQEKKEEIDRLAHKQVRRILWTGLGLAVVQVGLFFRLTFWEFSWDVMEPIAFFTTSTGIVIGYAYFMFTSRDPSYQDLLVRLFVSRQRKLIKSHNFDVVRFVHLQKQTRLPQYTSSSIKRRIGVDLDPDELLQ